MYIVLCVQLPTYIVFSVLSVLYRVYMYSYLHTYSLECCGCAVCIYSYLHTFSVVGVLYVYTATYIRLVLWVCYICRQ